MRDKNKQINGVIYRTTNTANGKWYIGKDESNNPDYLGSGIVLARAIAKYGRHCFQKEILAEASTRNELSELEKHFIALFDATKDPMSYNVASGGNGGNTIVGLDNEQKELFSQKLRNRWANMSLEQRSLFIDAVSKSNKGKKKSEEHKHKISLTKTGTKQSQETCQKKSIIQKQRFAEGKLKMPRGKDWTGLTHTEETKQKISSSKKGTIRNDIRKVTKEVLEEILADIRAGISVKEIAKKQNLSRKTIYAYIKDYR